MFFSRATRKHLVTSVVPVTSAARRLLKTMTLFVSKFKIKWTASTTPSSALASPRQHRLSGCKMSRRVKEPSMMELSEVYRMRNERIFGKRTQLQCEERPQNVCTRPSRKRKEPLKNGCTPFHMIQGKQRVVCTHAEDPQSFRNPKKNTCHSPDINERQIVQSRCGFVPVEFPPRAVKRDEVLCRRTTQRQICQVAHSQDERRTIQQGRRATKPVFKH